MSDGLVSASAAQADLDCLQRALEDRFSYLETSPVDHARLLDELRGECRQDLPRAQFGLKVRRLLTHFIDGHAAIDAAPSPGGYAPFLLGAVGDRCAAFKPDRSAFVDYSHPYLAAIDGVSLDTWLSAAGAYVASGSPQLVRHRSLNFLRALQFLRGNLGLARSGAVVVTLCSADGASILDKTLPVSEELPQFGSWPPEEPRLRVKDIAYLRLDRMRKGAGPQIHDFMAAQRDSDGLIIDVRGNGGGTREALSSLFPYFMTQDDEPRIVNVAAYRRHPSFGADHLVERQLYPMTSDHWSPGERAAIVRHASSFQPEWSPPTDMFSDWHYCVLSRSEHQDLFHYQQPVVVLADAGCFSATDVFLSALKGWRGVTVMGQPSSGGSGRAMTLELPATGFRLRLSSMASFQASGMLFDGRGVQPDMVVAPEPEDFLIGGGDAQLVAAIRQIRVQAVKRTA